MNGHGFDHAGEDLEGGQEGVDGVEEAFLVLLKVAVVGKGEALEGGQDGHKVPVDTAGLAASDFGEVGVSLLGHDAAAGGVLLGKGDEAEFLGGPEDEFFA